MTTGVLFKKSITGLLILQLCVLSAGYFVTGFLSVDLLFTEVIYLSFSFTIINLLSLIIFCRGSDKEPASQTMHILTAIAVKMLLEMVLALIWFAIAKKTGASRLILFFVLYLAFSFYSVYFMLNTLKRRTL